MIFEFEKEIIDFLKILNLKSFLSRIFGLSANLKSSFALHSLLHSSSFCQKHTLVPCASSDKLVIMVRLLQLLSIGFLCSEVNGLSLSSPSRTRRSPLSTISMSLKPKGCGAVPYNKKKVAVFGSGGYMGATIFGFVQRASAIYGTGLGGVSTPRSICATPVGSEALNRVLGRTFKLAFAGEDMVRLTNMQDVDAICQRLKGMDAAILGTVYQMERKSVALNTYEKTPNDKTFEFYLDDRYGSEWDVSPDDTESHLTMFKNSVDACKDAGLEHIVVIETPNTKDPKPFAKILDEAGVPFTYIRIGGKLETTKMYTFEEGIQADIEIDGLTLSDNYMYKNGYNAGDWTDSAPEIQSDSVIAREDVAALAVQSLISLEWNKSRCLKLVSKDSLEKVDEKKMKSDKEWCMKSKILAEELLAKM